MFLKKLYNNIIDKIINIYFKKEIKNNKLIKYFILFLKKYKVRHDSKFIYNFFKAIYLGKKINTYYIGTYSFTDNSNVSANYNLFKLYFYFITDYYNITILDEYVYSFILSKWKKSYYNLMYFYCKKYKTNLRKNSFDYSSIHDFSYFIYGLKRDEKIPFFEIEKNLTLNKANKILLYLYNSKFTI